MRKAYKKLTYADRQTIEHMTEQGAEPKKIAEVTGVHVATIYRELKKRRGHRRTLQGRVSAAGVICIKAAKVAHALLI